MSSAAIESFCGIQPEKLLSKSGAWGVIRAYYASFFAAHSIMRMFGISCSQLEKEHVDKVYESADAVSKTGGLTRLEKGFYKIKIDSNYNNIHFTKFKDSHRDTWGEFLELIKNLAQQSPNTIALSKHKTEAIKLLSVIEEGMTRSGCSVKGNWLSMIRNSVNYRHSHGVWYPYEKQSKVKSCISSLKDSLSHSTQSINLNLSRNDIECFFELSLIINSLFKELLLQCSLKSSEGNPVFKNGALKLIRTLKIN